MPEVDFSNPEFLERLRNRERGALEALVDAYLPQLQRAARGMGFTPQDNEDLVQSVFATMIESVGRFEGRSHIRTFLFGIFYNKASEHLRSKWRAQEHDSIDEVMEAEVNSIGSWLQPPVDIEKNLFEKEAKVIIQECLESIPQGQRAAFYLREVEEMKTEEICKKMGITATNLGVLLYRARNRLRECIEKKGLQRG